jgi:phosphoserine phosphatase
LLERVGTAIAVNPDARLRRHARRRGWAAERWS